MDQFINLPIDPGNPSPASSTNEKRRKHTFVMCSSAQTGKGTFVNYITRYLRDKYGIQEWPYVLYCSTIDPIKDIMTVYGWNGIKDEKSRKCMSDLKQVFSEWSDMPFKHIQLRIEYTEAPFIFVDCREPEEVARFQREFNAVSVGLKRDGLEEFRNEADLLAQTNSPDFLIPNNGSLEDLKYQAITFIDRFIKNHKLEEQLSKGQLYS